MSRPTASQAAGLGLSVARAIVGGALESAERMGIAISCAVVDAAGLEAAANS